MILKLNDNQSILKFNFEYHFQNNQHKVGLLGFYASNTINNITEKNNKIYYDNKVLTIPIGQYDFKTLRDYLLKNSFDLIKNGNKIEIKSTYRLTEKSDSITHLLNSSKKFIPVETINVHCNLAEGMLINNDKYIHKETNIISSFKLNSYFNTPIIHEPFTPIYFSVQHNNIYNVELRICDENDELIDFNGANITAILELN